jgi:hypothetical protein
MTLNSNCIDSDETTPQELWQTWMDEHIWT